VENDTDSLLQILKLEDTKEVFVDGFQGISIRNGVAKVNFFTSRQNEKSEVERVGAVILTMSLMDLIAIADGLNNVIAEIEKKGMIKRVETNEPKKD